jgi:hypothetical protein
MARKSKVLEAGAAQRSPLERARAALVAGNARAARQLADEAAANGPEAEREEARALAGQLAPDFTPLLVISGVLILIIVAAWLAILRHH